MDYIYNENGRAVGGINERVITIQRKIFSMTKHKINFIPTHKELGDGFTVDESIINDLVKNNKAQDDDIIEFILLETVEPKIYTCSFSKIKNQDSFDVFNTICKFIPLNELVFVGDRCQKRLFE